MTKTFRIAMVVLVLALTVFPCQFGILSLLGVQDTSIVRGRSWSTLMFDVLLMLLPLLAIGAIWGQECARLAVPGEDPGKYFDEVWKKLVRTTMSSNTASSLAPRAAFEAVQD